jgi:hypothetical protein
VAPRKRDVVGDPATKRDLLTTWTSALLWSKTELTMVRTWDKNGHPTWGEPMTDEEWAELEDWGLCGIKPWASLPRSTSCVESARRNL